MNACIFILLPKGEKCGVAMLSREKIRLKGKIFPIYFHFSPRNADFIFQMWPRGRVVALLRWPSNNNVCSSGLDVDHCATIGLMRSKSVVPSFLVTGPQALWNHFFWKFFLKYLQSSEKVSIFAGVPRWWYAARLFGWVEWHTEKRRLLSALTLTV